MASDSCNKNDLAQRKIALLLWDCRQCCSPFPLALNDSRSVLAVKGSLHRFAPWTAPGRSERRAAYEGKGGGRVVGCEGGSLVHDKGYYHSCLGRRRKLAFGHTRRLSRSRGALSPAGP